MTELPLDSEEDILRVFAAIAARNTSGTGLNDSSSRSHCFAFLTLHVHETADGRDDVRTSRFQFVDLAGSERIAKTGAQGGTLKEAQNINKSLTTLGLVINALTDGKSTHVPYRDSKLTRILQESLGGNSKTSLIVTCSPSLFNERETISTLRFGQRAKQIKNNAKVNREFSLKELQHMLKVAEEECYQKTKQIEELELKNQMQNEIKS